MRFLRFGGSNVDQPKQGKRPLALPITLILLVMSLMGNILLYTKHIENTRGNTQEQGQNIYDSFKESQNDVAYWSESLGRIVDYPDSESELARQAAALFAEDLQRNGSEGLSAMMSKAAAIDSERFEGAADDYSAYMKWLYERLLAIGEGSGPLNPDEKKAVENMNASFGELTERLAAFPYQAEGSRNALIRLAGGFDWLDTADLIKESMQWHQSRT